MCFVLFSVINWLLSVCVSVLVVVHVWICNPRHADEPWYWAKQSLLKLFLLKKYPFLKDYSCDWFAWKTLVYVMFTPQNQVPMLQNRPPHFRVACALRRPVFSSTPWNDDMTYADKIPISEMTRLFFSAKWWMMGELN